MNIQIKSRFRGSVIFELDTGNNSIALTLKAAVKAKTDLRDADLRGAYLRDADLRDANLRDANLHDANLHDADLRDANLHDAYLYGADLRGADLRGADLRGADLRGANLRGADLRDANLRGVDLCGANLRGADLRDADLCGAVGNKKELRTIQVDTYSISFTDSIMQIGCKRFSHKEWENFTDAEISNMDSGALEWWKKWKNFVFKAIELSFGEQVQP